MKTLLFFMLITAVGGCLRAEPLARPSSGPVRGKESLAESDRQEIQAAYEAGRHEIQRVPAQEGVWQAQNPGQQWWTIFDGDGFEARPQAGGWSWGLSLRSYGFAEQKKLTGKNPLVITEGHRLTYRWDELVEEWYVNDGRGLEHGFTVSARPAVKEKKGGEAGELSFMLETRGPLQPVIRAGGQEVSFQDAGGAPVVQYAGLKVWDATGTILPARFERWGEKGLNLLVDERQAQYPITIDPIAQQAYLKASNPGANDFFASVAVSGNTVVVGAQSEDSSTPGVNGVPNELASIAGAVYVFVRNNGIWTQEAFLKSSNPGVGDFFGISVALSGDTLVVGALGEDSSTTGVNTTPNDGAINAGAAYVFVRSGTNWIQQAYLKASNAGAGDGFGEDVAISGDTIVVGAKGEDSSTAGVGGPNNEALADSGAAYVFARFNNGWVEQAFLKPHNPGAADAFGFSVAVDDNTVVVGSFSEDSGSTGSNSVSDESVSGAGAAYVFVRGGITWTQQAYLKPGNPGVSDGFGISVAVSGNTVVVGANSEDGSGSGYNPVPDDSLLNSGAAYLFQRSGTSWQQSAYLKANPSSGGSEFGNAVAAAGDLVVVASARESSSSTGVNSTPNTNASLAGAAYVFTPAGPAWSQLAYLKAANAGASDGFGYAVGISGDTVVVGAPREDSSTPGVNSTPNDLMADAGAAYVFTGFGPVTTFAAWAANNIPSGQDAAFGGDANRDGIPNGVSYVFGSVALNPTGKGKILSPPAIPDDVNVFLERNLTLTDSPGWTPIVSWVHGAAPVFAGGVGLSGSEVIDTFAGAKAYYRYRVVLR